MKWRKAGIILLKAALIFVLGFVLFIAFVLFGAFGQLQNRKKLQNIQNANASLVLSIEGNLIGKFFSENRTNVRFDQIPPHLLDALISTEDIRFYKHKGIDLKSTFRVLFKSILFNDRSAGGGSTITQQLAKNLFGRENYGPLSILVNKTKEIFLANRLEKVFKKEDILLLYLNTVSFGENVFGIEAASLRYFNKKVENLTIEESALLIGMLKANTLYNPRLYPENAINRRNIVLRQMEKYEYLNSAVADSLSKQPLLMSYTNYETEKPFGYFLVQVKQETEQILQNIQAVTGKAWKLEEDGLIITTTLDFILQNYAIEAFHEHLSKMQKILYTQYNTAYGKKLLSEISKKEIKRLNLTDHENDTVVMKVFSWEGSSTASMSIADSMKQALTLLQAGLLAMDPSSGDVKAWVGGIDFNSQPYDQILARRQLASTFKPILFAAALEEGMNPCLYLDNDSVILEGFEDWSPGNFDLSYGGKYSFTGALVRSMNVPTFNLYLKLGFKPVDALWEKMGFYYKLDNTPSLAMGTAESNLKELAIAYSSFANGGYKVVPRIIISIKSQNGEIIYQNDSVVQQDRVISLKTSQLISAILQKAVNAGTGASMRSVFNVSLPLAAKTGTSQEYADAWFASFNPKLIMVSRVGASIPAIHFNSGKYGSGSALALPLVALTLQKLQENKDLMKQLTTSFPELPDEIKEALDCPDFMEDDFIDKFRDFFNLDKNIYDRDGEKSSKKKKPFFRRLFKNKNN